MQGLIRFLLSLIDFLHVVSSHCIVEKYVLDLLRSLNLLRILVYLRDKLLRVCHWVYSNLTFVVRWEMWPIFILTHWVVKTVVHGNIPRVSVRTAIWTARIVLNASPCQFDWLFAELRSKGKILLHLTKLKCLFVSLNSKSLKNMLILNESLRTAHDMPFWILINSRILIHDWWWLKYYAISLTNNLTLKFVFIPLLIFNLLLQLFPSLLIIQQSVKNRWNIVLWQTCLRLVLNLFL